MKSVKENLIVEKTFEFSLKIVKLYIELKAENEFILSRQLLKSATSIGANVEESIAAQSKSDFINKLSIANKEARETRYWLRLYEKSNLTNISMSNYLNDIEHIINILTKIIKTSKNII
jgi:four helix bundle protein